jgi:hypothetical protein
MTTYESQIALLEESGIEYDHSFMHHDCQMYYVPYAQETNIATDYKGAEASEWMKPMSTIKPSSIVEVSSRSSDRFGLALTSPATDSGQLAS